MPGLRMKEEKILEALLFASGESVALKRLAETINCDANTTRSLLIHMAECYESEQAGIQLLETEGAFRLCTNAAYSDYVRTLLNKPMRKALSQTLLETLAIVAYKQPCTKSLIEEIRGVNADHAVNKLLEYGLIVEKGRLDAPGKPILFGTSEDFLRVYGLRNLDEMFAFIPEEAVKSTEADSDALPLC